MADEPLHRTNAAPDMQDKARAVGVRTCHHVLTTPEAELCALLNADIHDVRGLVTAVSRHVLLRGAMASPSTAHVLRHKAHTHPAAVPTGIPELDTVLRGGIRPASVTEVVGPAAAGKTQFCLSVAVSASIDRMRINYNNNNNNNYNNNNNNENRSHQQYASKTQGKGQVIYIDTERAFNAQRLAEMARHQGDDTLVQRVLVVQPQSVGQLEEMVCEGQLENEIISRSNDDDNNDDNNNNDINNNKRGKGNVKLIVVDSIAMLVRREYGWNLLAQRQATLSRIASGLKYLAETFHIPVLVTNHATGTGTGIRREEATAALGNTWAHCVNTRLSVKHHGNNQRTITIVKSPISPVSTIGFTIGASGITPVARSTL